MSGWETGLEGHLGLLEEFKLDARLAYGDLRFFWNDRAEQVQLQQIGRAVHLDIDVRCDNVVVREGGGTGELDLHAHNTIRLVPAKLWSHWHNDFTAAQLAAVFHLNCCGSCTCW